MPWRTMSFQHNWQQILFSLRKVHAPQSRFWWKTSNQAQILGAKLASSKDAVTKHSLPIKIPSPHVVLLQDTCLLKGFKELILCRGCLLPKPYRHTCSRWRNAEAGLDGSPIRAALKQWELCWLAHLTPDKLGSSLGCICWENLHILISLFYL